MTKTEEDKIEELTKVLYGLAGDVKSLRATTEQGFRFIQERCDERHGANARRIEGVEQAERGAASFMDKLRGAALPISLCVAAIALVLTVVKW